MQTKIAITLDVEEHKLCTSTLPIPLDILDHHGIKATFFILGHLADQRSEVPMEILSRGHELGCHGYKHYPPYDRREFKEVKTDIEKGTKVIRKFCDAISFRSPYFRPHRKLATILEAFNYKCDSSVPSKRFDMFIGRTNNPYNLLCPMELYHPSRENVFRRGGSEIMEIPLSGFVFPLLGTTMRNLGLNVFTRFVNLLNFFSNIIVFDIHVWEFAEAIEGPSRHRRKRGVETALMFDALLHCLKRRGTFIVLSNLIK